MKRTLGGVLELEVYSQQKVLTRINICDHFPSLILVDSVRRGKYRHLKIKWSVKTVGRFCFILSTKINGRLLRYRDFISCVYLVRLCIHTALFARIATPEDNDKITRWQGIVSLSLAKIYDSKDQYRPLG